MLEQRVISPQAILALDHCAVALDCLGAFGGTVSSETNLSKHLVSAAVVDSVFGGDRSPQGRARFAQRRWRWGDGWPRWIDDAKVRFFRH
jgi:hypothetical protein